MGLDFENRLWTGSVHDLVALVGDSDARLGPVTDAKSGAKISMNLDGGDSEEGDEPFYIESPDGENLYDAYNRKEAVMILSNIREGKEFPEQPDDTPKLKPAKKNRRKSRKRSASSPTSVRGIKR